MTRISMGLVAIGLLCALCSTARAQDDEQRAVDSDRRPVTLGAQLQYGIWTGDNDVNAYSLGVGVRAGVTFGPGLYLGAAFDYFMGEKRSATGPFASSASARVNVYDFMGELGYDVWFQRANVLRPKLGIGLGVLKGGACIAAAGVSTCGSQSKKGVALEPGLEYLHFFDQVYLSIDARYQMVSIDGSDPSAIVLGAGLGVAL